MNTALWVRQGLPSFARLRQSSHEGARILPVHPGTECTKPSHSESLANSIANVHLQGISAARTKVRNFMCKAIRIRVVNSFATLNSQRFVWDLVAKIRWRLIGAHQILTLQPLLFFGKRKTPQKIRVVLFAEPLESLEKE